MEYIDKIEKLRRIMHVTALQKGMSHPDVLLISQQTDEALNEFYNASISKNNLVNKIELENNVISLKQKTILNFIRSYPQQYPLSIREIAAAVGITSISAIHHHLIKLEEKGYIVRENNRARCVVVKDI